MGEVYRARDPRLGREVAIKILPASLSQDPDRLRRFEQEARAVGVLNHPNIVSVYDVGTQDGAPYVVQELLEGETLRGRLGVGAFAPRKALGHALQIAHGLAAAHDKGIVHRDLKPENVFVTRDGRVKILDFGLAKLVASGVEDSVSRLPTTAGDTQPGVVLGTLGYMAPEQVRGKPADARSDIFSFGAILYEMLSGQRAFHGDSAADTMSAILMKEPPDLSATNRDVPPGLDRLVRHCLEKSPEERFQSARDLAFGLESLSDVGAPVAADRAASPSRPRRTRWLLLAAGAAAAIMALAAILWLRRSVKPMESVAVLPFANGSRDPDAEYLSDGITEGIINNLARLPNLRVTARSTAFHYKGRDEDPQKIGRDLNVRAVVSGRIVLRGDAVSVQADLVDVSSGSQIWGDRFDRGIAEVQSVQDEIALGIAEKLHVRPRDAGEARASGRAANPEAYQLYLKGRHEWEKRTEAGMRQAVDYLQQAIEKDPGYALAYAGLADAYAVFPSYSLLSPTESYTRARAASRKALEIDDSLAQAHANLGICFMNFDRDWTSSESEYKKAISLDGSYATAHHWYGLLLMVLGRFDESTRELHRARELDPFSTVIQGQLARVASFARQADRAVEEGRKAVAMDPGSPVGHTFLANSYTSLGMTREAIAENEKLAAMVGRTAIGLYATGRAQALSGRRAEAARTLEEMKALSRTQYVSSGLIATVFGMIGDKDRAFEFWEKACEEHSFEALFLKADPAFDNLRGDPRFPALLKKAGFGP
jgi:TolB-like protein/Tfp pilus assembly protein PilF